MKGLDGDFSDLVVALNEQGYEVHEMTVKDDGLREKVLLRLERDKPTEQKELFEVKPSQG